jgi:hypothetical protein
MSKSYFGLAILALATCLHTGTPAQVKVVPKGILRHTAAFNFKPGVPQETIDKMLADARATLPTIEGTSNIVVGPQTSGLCKYKYAMSVDFVDKEAKVSYARSPQSKRLHESYKQFVEDEIIVDVLSQ